MSATRDTRAGLVFSALADPTRRLLVRRLAAGGPETISALAADLPISRQATAKHLGILADAGLIDVTATGRERHCSFVGEPLTDAVGWMVETGDGWDRRLDRLRRAAQTTSPK